MLPGRVEGPPMPEVGAHNEVERKFVVTTLPDNLTDFRTYHITQGYLDQGYRLRDQEGSSPEMTVKTGSGLTRTEIPIPLTREQFDALWEFVDGRIVEKQRTEIPYEGNTIFLDNYEGNLQALAVAEVEFKDEGEAKNFNPPTWFGQEVTGLSEYLNEGLAISQRIPGDLNQRRATGAPENEIVPSVSLEQGVRELIDDIEGKLLEKKTSGKGGPLFVMVAGRTSSGKTSAVTAEIIKKYGDRVSVLSMDDYSKGNKFIADMAEQGVNINWDHPLYMDFALIREHLKLLAQGKTIEKPTFSFKTGERAESESFAPNDIVIVEGLFALRDEIADLGDVKAFVDISLHGSIVRRLLRDVKRTNMDPAQILGYYLRVVEPMYQEHIAPTKLNADKVLLNEYNPLNEAARSGLFEVQAKFRVENARRALQQSGAELLAQVEQEDHYIIPNDRDVRESDESVRIRRQGDKSFFAYKGPKTEGAVRIRPKLEFEIDRETSQALLERYGKDSIVVTKQRELYLLDGVVVALDRVRRHEGMGQADLDLGEFVEIRTNDRKHAEARIRRICESLGIDYSTKVTTPYFEM